MRVLRVLVVAPPDPARADSWVLSDANGRVLQHGRSFPAQWPPAERREAVLAADAVRVIALALPPLPRERLVAAATYALEDQLATSADDAVVAIGARGHDGRVDAVIAARELIGALVAATPPFSRAVAEPELAQPVDGWRWCESETSAFVRTADGGAFTVSHAPDAALPPELAHALAQAVRNGSAPAKVIADRPADAAMLASWQQQTGIPFVAGAPWRWEAAPSGSFASATDLFSAVRQASSTRTAPSPRRFAFALTMVALALGLHVLAAVGTWAWQRSVLARTEQAIVAIAQQAGARNADAGNAAASTAMLNADARHRAGLAAPNDAMPLLARAAPALAALPPGALRTATWTAGAWTLELAPLDETVLAGFMQRLAGVGLTSLHARTASGVRARVTPSP